MRTALKIVVLNLVLFSFALLSIQSTMAEQITYRIDGSLEEGGIFEGTMAFDTLAPDTNSSSTRGAFASVDALFFLTDTTLFSTGGPNGTGTSASLFQSSSSQSQVLYIDFASDTGNFGAFTEITFEPFTGDPNVLAPILTDSFAGGYFDGAGQSNIATFNITQVPEPSGFLIPAFVSIAAISRRRSRTFSA